jgi:hypothetical protein
MPATTPIREVAKSLLPRVDEMTSAMVEGYRHTIPEYPRLLQKHGEDVYAVSRMALLSFLEIHAERLVSRPVARLVVDALQLV